MFAFCKPVSSKKRFLPFRGLNDDFSFSLYEKALAIPQKDWELITKKSTIFLEKDYLQILENCQHTKLIPRYAIVYFKNQPCGIIYFQIVDFKAEIFGDLLYNQVEAIKSTRLSLFEKYIGSNKEEVLLRLFTCGNNLVSGEYGFLFSEKINKEEAHTVLLKLIDVVSKEEKLARTISAILIKDFHLPLEPKNLLKGQKYSDFFVEPNLIVDIPEGVDSIDSYVALFSKKYRNRAKSIFKNLDGVEIRSLNKDEILLHEERLYNLYEGIFEKAKFKLIKLPKNYFSSVKSIYENKFNVKAFFYNNKIIAFASCFKMPDNSLEAHYIGLDYEFNSKFNLYQNILYAMIDEAINNKLSKVNLGRTAAEIKTTVGAKAVDLICYIKPQNTISKIIQKPFISFLQPAEWIPRNPFKEEGLEK